MKVITNASKTRLFLYRIAVCSFLYCLHISYTSAQKNYGLTFNSFNAPQENRTSLEIGINNSICFSDNMDMSFEFYFIPNRSVYFGYIFRMVNKSGQNIDLLYNEKDAVFNTIIGGTFTNINFSIDKETLYRNWTKISYHYSKDSLSCFINNRLFKTVEISLKDKCFKVLFGANNSHEFSTTDVPPMVIRKVAIEENGRLAYFWPLNSKESDDYITDSISKNRALVTNPVWTEELHENWQLLKSLTVKGNASVAYNQDSDRLYITAEDSVYSLPVDDIMSSVQSEASNGYHLFQGNQSVYNTVDNKLYNFYIDIKQIAEYSNKSFNWNHAFDTVANTEYGHTNRVFVRKENALYIFGGYGQMKYKNQVQKYSFATKKWENVITKGDYFTPRYMAAAGISGDHIYILGGYGSHSGDQVLNPGYLYDLLDFNISTQTFKKLYSLKEPDTSFVFAGSMYIDSADHSYYALCFDRSKYDTKLRLIKGSLFKPEYQFLGNSIPYSFHDVVSDADLYFSPGSKQLIAVTQLVDLGKRTEIKIYGIAFAPEALMKADVVLQSHKLWYIAAALFILAIITWLFIKNKKRANSHLALHQNNDDHQKESVLAEPSHGSHTLMELGGKTIPEAPGFVTERANNTSIYLFGSFEIIDENGDEISKQFSPLLKELFLVILLNKFKDGKGITSEKLNDIFWGTKTGKDAKNNLSVNIVRLKNILAKVDGINVTKNGDHWECEYDSNKVSIDLLDFLNLETAYPGEKGKEHLSKMLYFISRGPFLKQNEYEWLDNIKADISNKIIDELLEESKNLDPKKEAEYIIEVANCIFSFDLLNEDALIYKCKTLNNLGRHSIAKSTYERFAKEYKKSYGEEFSLSFQDILK